MTAPVAPVLVPATSFVLNWSVPAQPAGEVVAGFVISYGPNAMLGSYAVAPNGSARSHVFNGMARGTWFFQIRAYTAKGVASAGSALYEVAL